MPTTQECGTDCCGAVSKEWLLAELRSDSKGLVVMDCRGTHEYEESHIRNSVNFSIPTIMLRRLAAGKIDLVSTIKCRELKSKIGAAYKESVFVLYNDGVHAAQHNAADSTLAVLMRRLAQDGCRVVCLEDGFSRFKAAYPEWCDSCVEILDSGTILPVTGGADPLPLMGLRSLRISAPPLHRPHRSCDSLSSTANSSTDSSDTDDRCDSSLGLEEDKEFPVEILPYLFLGNAANSEDSQALARHSIQYVLNVTPDLPNVFEELGSIKYMQIPITDHWSQNLASHFPRAIEFIDEARTRNKGILVHCLAGISRSVTITVAYLMYKCSLNLNDAFNLVRSRKSNIAPNFHFMEQLHNFEKELKLDVSSQSPTVILEQIRREQQQRTANIATITAIDDTSGGGGGGKPHNAAAHHHLCSACRSGGKAARNGPDCKCSSSKGSSGSSNFLSPLGQIGVSPDSGIEFDRWASSATPGD